MMKKLLLFLFLSFPCICWAQKEAAVWYFGVYAGLDFNCSPPKVVHPARTFGLIEGSSTICDKEGNLLFYTNGDSMWNRNHKVMPNGFDLGQSNHPIWGSSSQGSIIIPWPKQDNLYYLFTTDNAENRLGNGFNYSTIDMSMDGGLGDVSLKKQLLIDSVAEKLTAVRHGNGVDYWVITHQYNTDAFYAYQITPLGLNSTPVISHTGQVYGTTSKQYYPESLARGYMKVSPNGKKIILCPYSDHHFYPLRPEVFNFDDQTGKVTLDFSIDDKDSIRYYGASFSPNSQVLYLTSGWGGRFVHQFDMSKATDSKNFLDSRLVLYDGPAISNPPYPAGISIGPDGRIYLSANKSWVDVIENPNVVGTGCGYTPKAIELKSCKGIAYSASSMPNYIQSFFLSPWTGGNCDSIGANFTFEDSCAGKAITFNASPRHPKNVGYWKWEITDPYAPSSTIEEDTMVQYTFDSAGTYNVKLYLSQSGPNDTCFSDSIIKSIHIVKCKTDTIVIPIDTSDNNGSTDTTFAEIYIPNAFTPNGDGINDVFQILGPDIAEVQLMIFNRWGEKLLDQQSASSSWDGYYMGKICQQGMYAFIAEITFNNGTKLPYNGQFLLIRE